MISQNRWNHILGVARKAKLFASRLKPNNPQYTEDMFLLGLLHDFGYEFSESNQSHAFVGGQILKRSGYKYHEEVSLHGNATVEKMSDELFILNCADMTTGPNGEDLTMDARLEEIGNRLGFDSDAYKKCAIEIQRLQTDKRYHRI